jgi:predicted permease
VPAIQASKADVNGILKDEARGGASLKLGNFSKALVVVEVGLSCGLLVAAGLMIKSVVNLKYVDYPFPVDEIFTARVGLFESDYPTDETQRKFFRDLLGRLEGKPGVRAVAVASNLPAAGSGREHFAIAGTTYAADRDYPTARRAIITPGFFRTFAATVRDGREFTAFDKADSPPVAIVNQSFARKFFSGGNPIGMRIRQGRSDSTRPWMTVVGVAPDLMMGQVDNRTPEGIYVPLEQNPSRFMSIAIRTEGRPMALTSMVREHVGSIDRNLPIFLVNPLSQLIKDNTWFYGVFGSLFMIFGFAALFLASIGLYGVMSFSVSRRTQEIGVRIALGAQPVDVLRLVLRQGVIELLIGVAVGVGLAAGLSTMMSALLFQVEPWDPLIFACIVLALLAIGLIACLVPARRALRVDPIVALRYE